MSPLVYKKEKINGQYIKLRKVIIGTLITIVVSACCSEDIQQRIYTQAVESGKIDALEALSKFDVGLDEIL